MVFDTNNEGAALVGGSLLTTGGRMKTLKIVGVGKAVYIQTGKGSTLLHPGDILDAPENEAKLVIGVGRARVYDPATDDPAVIVTEIPAEETVGDMIVVEPTPALYVGGTEPLAVIVGTSRKRKGG